MLNTHTHTHTHTFTAARAHTATHTETELSLTQNLAEDTPCHIQNLGDRIGGRAAGPHDEFVRQHPQ